MTTIAFKLAPFKTSGGTHTRSLNDWFSDVINVKEMGATGDGSTDDVDAIQAALDLAFGSSSSPHGLANAHLNRPVFFPAGKYLITEELDLTRVVGGHIYGAGKLATEIVCSDTSTGATLFRINGASGLCMEKMGLTKHASTNGSAIDLDWDGTTGGDGLHDNYFSMLQIGCIGASGSSAILIGKSDNEGYNNMFVNVTVGGGSNLPYGVEVRGAEALNNQFIGGGGGGGVITAQFYCPPGGGSIHVQGYAGYAGSVMLDFLMESDHVMHISQGRTENHRWLRQEAGTVIMQSMLGYAGVGAHIELNGGKLLYEGNSVFCFETGTDTDNGKIEGTGGTLLLAANIWTGDAHTLTPLEDFSGTIAWDPEDVFGGIA